MSFGGRPIVRESVPRLARKNRSLIMDEQRKPNIPGEYIYVGDFDSLDPPVATFRSPPWENGWTWLGTAYVGFRFGLDGDLEFKGTLDTTGATSGTVAFTLPFAWRPSEEFSFLTDLDLGSGDFDAARVVVATNGEVTVYFPLTA